MADDAVLALTQQMLRGSVFIHIRKATMDASECSLMDERDMTVAMGSRDQMARYMKHHLDDGMYSIKGPGIDMTYYRIDGIVYPSGGSQDGRVVPHRTREECSLAFG
jgi:hypothetical protein